MSCTLPRWVPCNNLWSKKVLLALLFLRFFSIKRSWGSFVARRIQLITQALGRCFLQATDWLSYSKQVAPLKSSNNTLASLLPTKQKVELFWLVLSFLQCVISQNHLDKFLKHNQYGAFTGILVSKININQNIQQLFHFVLEIRLPKHLKNPTKMYPYYSEFAMNVVSLFKDLCKN